MSYLILICILASLLYIAIKSLSVPAAVLPIVISTFALEQLLQTFFPMLVQRSWLTNLAVAAFVVAVLILATENRKRELFSPPPLYISTTLFFVFVVSSILWSPREYDGILQLRGNGPYIILFCFIAPLCLTATEDLPQANWLLLIFGFLILVGLAVSQIGYRGVVLDRVQGRDVEANPLAIASFANLMAIAATLTLYTGSLSLLRKLTCMAVVLLAIYVMIRSGSRGQTLSYFITICLWLPYAAKLHLKRSPIPFLILLGICGAVAALLVSELGFSQRFSQHQIAAAGVGRLKMAQDLFQAYSDRGIFTWLFGLGNSSSFKIAGFYPHIVLIEVLCEEGVVGFGWLAYLIVKSFKLGLQLTRDKNIPLSIRNVVLILLAGETNVLILSFKEGSLLGTSPLLFLYVLTIAMSHFLTYRFASGMQSRPLGITAS